MSGMQFHAPFIVTKYQQRSDLGDCIISTRPPYITCKIHGFKTAAAAGRTDNPKLVAMAEREEQARVEYLQQRQQAFRNRIEADRQDITIRQLIEQQGRVYDEELDEPRIVCKVPGLNVYLELVGCLQPLPDEDPEWLGDNGRNQIRTDEPGLMVEMTGIGSPSSSSQSPERTSVPAPCLTRGTKYPSGSSIRDEIVSLAPSATVIFPPASPGVLV